MLLNCSACPLLSCSCSQFTQCYRSRADSTMFHEQASGGALALVDAVVEASKQRSAGGEVPAGYSIARPPGHHATATQSMGFCLLNNVAIAARYAQQHHGLKKVKPYSCFRVMHRTLCYLHSPTRAGIHPCCCCYCCRDWASYSFHAKQSRFCKCHVLFSGHLLWSHLACHMNLHIPAGDDFGLGCAPWKWYKRFVLR